LYYHHPFEINLNHMIMMILSMYVHGICLAPHTPSTEVIDGSMSSANGIQGARHIDICMHDDELMN